MTSGTVPDAARAGEDVDAFARVARELELMWRARGDRSFDPYDGLEARRVPDALRRHRVTRLALVQWHKRLPFNSRRLFGIAPTRNAYAVGQLVSACVKLDAAGAGDPDLHKGVDERLEWLEGVRTRGGWTYPFEVQTKTSHYEAASPNVISTVFGATAFLDAAELGGDARALSVAAEACGFVTRELARDDARGPFFAYLPDEDVLIHNANLLAARLLVRTGALAGDGEMIERGVAAATTSVAAVRPDGSLVYGDGPAMGWVDGHHTGFVVDALHGIRRIRPDAVADRTFAAMVDHYRDRLFGADGRPFQAPGRPDPVDAIAGAQGIQTFASIGGSDRDVAVRIARFMLDRMRARSGSFLYHRRRLHSKRVPYLRWADAPMCDALATLTLSLKGTRR